MDHFEKYYTLALRYLQIRPRSEKEIVDYLRKKKITEAIILRVIAKLKEQKFLNDELFAKMWIESRNRSKPRSMWLLSRELQQKGVAKIIIDQVLETQGEQTDLALAKEAIERRIGKYKTLPRQEIYQKVGGFLARRGFNWETSKHAIDEVLKEGYNTEE